MSFSIFSFQLVFFGAIYLINLIKIPFQGYYWVVLIFFEWIMGGDNSSCFYQNSSVYFFLWSVHTFSRFWKSNWRSNFRHAETRCKKKKRVVFRIKQFFNFLSFQCGYPNSNSSFIHCKLCLLFNYWKFFELCQDLTGYVYFYFVFSFCSVDAINMRTLWYCDLSSFFANREDVGRYFLK